MAFLTKTLTLTGAAQNAESGGPTITADQNSLSPPCCLITFQQESGEVINIGSDATVSATVYGAALTGTAAPFEPFQFFGSTGNSIKLADFWVFGTAGKKLHIAMVLY